MRDDRAFDNVIISVFLLSDFACNCMYFGILTSTVQEDPKKQEPMAPV